MAGLNVVDLFGSLPVTMLTPRCLGIGLLRVVPFQACWLRSTDLGPVIGLPTGVAFRLVSRALSWCMCATTVPTCVRSYCLNAVWTPHIIELLDVGGRSFVCPPQPQCFFQSEALVLAERVLLEVRVSNASNDQFQESLICLCRSECALQHLQFATVDKVVE